MLNENERKRCLEGFSIKRLLIKLIRRAITVLKVILVILIVINIVNRNESRILSKYITNIFIPSGMATNYKSNHWGAEKFWLYKMNNEEDEEISADLKKGKWIKLSENNYIELKKYYTSTGFYVDEMSEEIDFQNTYYVIYDYPRKSYIDIKKLSELYGDLISEFTLIIFIYDATHHYYYTIMT